MTAQEFRQESYNERGYMIKQECNIGYLRQISAGDIDSLMESYAEHKLNTPHVEAKLLKRNAILESENESLKKQNEELSLDNYAHVAQHDGDSCSIEMFKKQIEELQTRIDKYLNKIFEMDKQIEELKNHLALNIQLCSDRDELEDKVEELKAENEKLRIERTGYLSTTNYDEERNN